ncbi:MAG: helix-turn-helix domain-containing protein [bacterium]
MSRGKPPAPPIPINLRQHRLLEKEASKQRIPYRDKIRYEIILRASEGQSNSHIKRELGISLNKVKRWRRRWESEWESLCVYESGPDGQEVKDHELLGRIREILSDKPRSGTPKRITLSQEKQIIAIACEKPEKYGVIMTQWNREMLARAVIDLGIVSTISPRYISVILKKKRVASS